MSDAMSGKMLSGYLDNRVHHYPLRIYYDDTDAAGIVYYANYLKLAERARTEMMRLIGFDHGIRAREKNQYFAVKHCEIDYVASARLDDLLDMRSELIHIGGASIKIAQSVWRGDVCCAKIRVVLVFVESNIGVIRIPSELRALLNNFIV